MTDARSNMAADPVWNSRTSLVVAAPSPKGAEMVFHDPLPTPKPESQRSRVPVVFFMILPNRNPPNRNPSRMRGRLHGPIG